MPDPLLNAIRVAPDPSACVVVTHLPYVGDDEYRHLRAEHRQDHLLRRAGAQIECVTLRSGADPLGHKPREVKLADHAGWLALLVEETLLRRFHGSGRDILALRPLEVASEHRAPTSEKWPPDQLQPLDRDLHDLGLPSWAKKALGWRITYRFALRRVWQQKPPAAVLLSLDIGSRVTIDTSWLDLYRAGLSLFGLYVQVDHPSPHPSMSRHRLLVGEAARLEQDSLVLQLPRPGYERVPAATAWLEPRRENLKQVLDRLLRRDAEWRWKEIEGRAWELRRGPARKERIDKALKSLVDKPLQLVEGGLVHFTWPEDEATSRSCFEIRRFDPPLLHFAPGGTRTSEHDARGLDEHGPYDRQALHLRKPRIAVICDKDRQGEVDVFVQRLLHGLPELEVTQGRSSYRPFGKGLLRRFFLEDTEPRYFLARGGSHDAYEEAVRDVTRARTEDGDQWDLCLVQTNGDPHSMSLPPHLNPYWVTKAALFKRNIPCQAITLENIRAKGESLAYILSNVSLSCYAKWGGNPWRLPANQAVAHEIIIGMGTDTMRRSRFGPPDRVVGLCAIFNKFGEYLLDTRTEVVPYGDYALALYERLTEAIRVVKTEQNWRPTDHVRVIFHASKAVKDKEVEAVTRVMGELGLPHAQHAFLHVEQAHPYLLFDPETSHHRKGAWAPRRGTWLRLGAREAVLALKGPRQLKRGTDGLPGPLLLRLHQDSTFTDLGYLSEQVYHFACHSWKAFGGASKPVTVRYSECLAHMMRGMREVPGWDEGSVDEPIGRKPWHL